MKKTFLFLVACLWIFAATAGESKTATFTGRWNTNWGPMEMTQKGSQVMGHYTGQFKGIIDGTVSGNRLDFTWSQPNGEHGKGYFVLSGDGNSIDGMWGTDESDSNGGNWTGTRSAAAVKK
jgi:hypothetical protein